MKRRHDRRRNGLVRAGLLFAMATVGLMLAWCTTPVKSARPDTEAVATIERGEDIFHREWLADDPRSHAGDGLGPVFNESSCVACHNLGGAGGAGTIEKNVNLLSASGLLVAGSGGPAAGAFSVHPKEIDEQTRNTLVTLHPGFRDATTVVLHRFGIDQDAHNAWWIQAQNGIPLAQIQEPVAIPVEAEFNDPAPGQPVPVFEPEAATVIDASQLMFTAPVQAFNGVSGVDAGQFPVISRVLNRINSLKQDLNPINQTSATVGNSVVQSSQRNTSALFGIGLIDDIPDEVIEAVAQQQADSNTGVTGRVHRLEDGSIGRFGWKAQKASLYDFTMTACAVEVGLHVPGHEQAPVPYDSEHEPPGLDLNQDQLDALVAYIRSLPPPTQNDPGEDETRNRIQQGKELFKSAGCAVCHVDNMGDVDGLYSDLLLHDLGPELGGVGHYGIQSTPAPESDEQLGATDDGQTKPAGPSATEWRTPPLWGVRDSAPYLHDGRARTLETAIAFHGGEAADSRLKFFRMTDDEQQSVVAFLKTLTAPRDK